MKGHCIIEDKDTLLDIARTAKRVAYTLRKSSRMTEVFLDITDVFLNIQLGLSNVIKCSQLHTDHSLFRVVF